MLSQSTVPVDVPVHSSEFQTFLVLRFVWRLIGQGQMAVGDHAETTNQTTCSLH